MATSGAVTRLFERKGQLVVRREAANEDQLMEIALEAGAEDFAADEHGYEILTDPSTFEAVHKAVDAKQIECASASVTFLPSLTIPLTDPGEIKAVTRLIEVLDDHDDVQEIHSNADLPPQEESS